MMLHAHWQGHHQSTRPVLVWLHGFLGSAADWQPVQRYFSHWPLLSVDLPGHGGSQAQTVTDFDDLSQRLNATLHFHQVDRYWLIGYSLGGRLALYHACRHAGSGLAGLLVEAGHFGLSNPVERRHRRDHDLSWAARFRQQPLGQVLDLWYQQPVFAELTAVERQRLVARRLNNRGEDLAAMLQATSLSAQPDLLPELREKNFPFRYLCGEWDQKFLQLARQAALPPAVIPAAGHNTHLANPLAFAHQLARVLNHN
ncbi:2-succinyl-6-hydroxy-2,4-cyclohexadiene-1-carboxylate synthase [Erwinia persicina]|uniref:2-succinyl-6-hydroxy-2, 4-cyclohexadiene-1-carboxylate synthase n=1 Tax=Erwinia persicina TaxID=55211 RepID=UPI001C9AF464|nr:2-succinyl-6-hydroxy-2,4-cyclohexadiene-1-carboxylate synthase [Erwinia persicina]QZQ51483.1 2-succinyl-6-hydroxy-2,4-cyclohexadiene-1-carboxylate synthase [Erwinia persicina]